MFMCQEFPYPVVPDKYQILYFAHSVAGSVSLIQVLKPPAGKFGAFKAERPGPLFANSQAATGPCLRLVALRVVTPVTRVPLPKVSFAYRAVHAAWSNESFGDFARHSIFLDSVAEVFVGFFKPWY